MSLAETGILSTVLEFMTTNITGSLFITLVFLFFLFFLIMLGGGLEPFIVVLIAMPLILVLMIITAEFLIIGITLFLLLAGYLAVNFFLR
jgi:hypothetical protein